MAGDGPPNDATLSPTVERIRAKLRTDRPPYRFSPEGIGILNERQSEYVEDLAGAAIEIARRHSSDAVSAEHVRQADQVIRVAERLRSAHMFEVIGAWLAGGGLGLLLTQWAQRDAASSLGWILGGVVTTLGLILLVWGVASQRT